jgi:DNA-binding HxlR family transcriptional regulator
MIEPTPLCSLHNESYAMQHTRFDTMPCPIARGLDRVGEWWSILIMRDAFRGKTRFDQFQKSLGIAPNILSRRLRGLVEAGLLEKIRYNDRPPRDEYVLTPIGQDFRPVLWAMLAWGNKHFMPNGQQMVPADNAAGPTDALIPPFTASQNRNDLAAPQQIASPDTSNESRTQS